MTDINTVVNENSILQDIVDLKPTVWINPHKDQASRALSEIDYSIEDIYDADRRLRRFAPLLVKYFEDTRPLNGLIESPLKPIKKMEEILKKDTSFRGNLYLKMDSHLAIAGSVKARGGIYEVLYLAEKIALEKGLITHGEDYSVLSEEKNRKIFAEYTIQVGSTGNLGLSIGIVSATLGFNVIVHMSSDAKQWKKDLLRSKGAKVVEYQGDFTSAVEKGRELSDADPNSYFVDDENSEILFMGYAVAALRLQEQLKAHNIQVDEEHPAFFYIPCGVGGAPGGITFGLKQIFGDYAHVFFVEPTHAPSMLVGMATGRHDKISVQDLGIDGKTEADGLAVGTPSKFVGKKMVHLLSGIFTLEDKSLFDYMRILDETEHIRIEPSACATFEGPAKLLDYESTRKYLEDNDLIDRLNQINHITWATGGNLVPEYIMEDYLKTYL